YNFLTTPSATLAPPLLKILKPENIAEKIKASKPSTSSSRITVEMVRFVEILLDYVQDRAPVPSLVFKKLRHLQAFFILTTNRCIEHESMKGDFFIHVEDVAYTALQLCFLAVAYYMEEDEEQERIYKSLLIASKSSRSETTIKSECMLDFVNALREDLKEHLRHGRIWWLEKGLLDLSIFLQDIEYKRAPLKRIKFSSITCR
ncbi:hypothetical protein HAX54_051243, partial [Datura stramonium]|nr:hypothetical protein [Datura stramonium]